MAEFGDVLAGEADPGPRFAKMGIDGGAAQGAPSGTANTSSGQGFGASLSTKPAGGVSAVTKPQPKVSTGYPPRSNSLGLGASEPEKTSTFADAFSSDEDDDFAPGSPTPSAAGSKGAVQSRSMNSPRYASGPPKPSLITATKPAGPSLPSPNGSSSAGGSYLNEQAKGSPTTTAPAASSAALASYATSLRQREGGVIRFRDVIVPSGGKAGITCSVLPEYLANSHFGGANGVLISRLTNGGSAANAGLLVGDVIVKVNGEAAVHHSQVVNVFDAQAASAEDIKLTVLASNALLELTKGGGKKIGLTCVASPQGGVVVSSVAKGTLLEERGVCPGHLLLSINGTMVTAPAQATSLVDEAESTVRFVLRDNAHEFVLQLPKEGGANLTVRDHDSKVGVVVEAASGPNNCMSKCHVGDVLLALDGELLTSAKQATELFAAATAKSPELRVVKRQ